MLHALLGLSDLDHVRGHPKLGSSWEGFAMVQVVDLLETRDAYFGGTHGGAELDLLVLGRGRRYGFEFKHMDAPGTTRSMHIALADLGIDHLWVVYPGAAEYADPTDLPFLDVAVTGAADYLVTGNAAQYVPVHGSHSVAIVSPRQYVDMLDQEAEPPNLEIGN